MGPSVIFFHLIGVLYLKKMGVSFFLPKKDHTRGGGRSVGGMAKDHTFLQFLLGPFPNQEVPASHQVKEPGVGGLCDQTVV